MNGGEFGSLNLLKLKYRKGEQKIFTFKKIGSPQKFIPQFLICGNSKSLRKVLLNHADCTDIE